MSVESLKLKNLKINGGTQPRDAISNQTVDEYAEAMRNGEAFPPVVVYHDGASYWLVDGFHRYHAHRRTNKDAIQADIREGTLRDAVLYSLSVNVDHGLRRTNADKRKAVTTMLINELVAVDEDGKPWSDRAIAKQCAVHHSFVSRTRGSLSPSDSENSSKPRAYTTKHGSKAVMKTARIGRKRKPGGMARNAMKPVLGHSTHVKKTALELPHDPHWAAKGLLSAFGAEFARALITELTNCLKGTHQ